MVTYTKIRDNLSIEAMAEIVCAIKDSKGFELDELGHIVLKHTNERIGYLSDESIQLCNYPMRLYRDFHNRIIDMMPAVDEVTYQIFGTTDHTEESEENKINLEYIIVR